MLIRWPFEQASREGLRCYVDSSAIGYPLYRKMGFTQCEGEINCNLDEYGEKGFGVHRWVAMLREPQEQQVDQ